MCSKKLSLEGFSIETLDDELIARGSKQPFEERFRFEEAGTPARDEMVARLKEIYDPARIPPCNSTLESFSMEEILDAMLNKIDKLRKGKGLSGKDDRIDYHDIKDERAVKNADSTALICLKDQLINKDNRYWEIKTNHYGKTFGLFCREPFFDQPVTLGYSATGFLVGDQTIITAGHVITDNKLENLRFVFGYHMKSTKTPVTEIPAQDVYHAIAVKDSRCERCKSYSDWAIVTLDRKVVGHPIAKISDERVYYDQPVYVIGHPWGLPLKFAPGASIKDIKDAFFVADLDVYCGNSGSPVFSSRTHEVIGLVARGDDKDFRWTGKGYRSVVYFRDQSKGKPDGAQCTLATEFKNRIG